MRDRDRADAARSRSVERLAQRAHLERADDVRDAVHQRPDPREHEEQVRLVDEELAAGIVPGAEIRGVGGAILVAAIVGLLNAILPPIIAALRLPYTVAIGFLLVLALDAAINRIGCRRGRSGRQTAAEAAPRAINQMASRKLRTAKARKMSVMPWSSAQMPANTSSV